MSEKRFRKGTIDFLDGNGEQWCVIDKEQKIKSTTGYVDKCIIDSNIETCIDDLVTLLNELSAKIGQLKEENEQLHDLQYYRTKSARNEEELLFLRKQNEQLRKTVKQQQIRIHCQDQEIQKLLQEGKQQSKEQ